MIITLEYRKMKIFELTSNVAVVSGESSGTSAGIICGWNLVTRGSIQARIMVTGYN